MSTFDKIVVTEHGGADKLHFQKDGGSVDEILKKVGEGEVVIKNRYAGVNFIDTYFRSGLYPSTPPFTVGQEGAGEVVAVGGGVDKSLVGKRVAFWGNKTGGYAGYVIALEKTIAPLAEDADLRIAAATILQGLTSHYLCYDAYHVKKSDWVLVHAAAGGCGLLLTQMCKNLGAVVIGTCGSSDKAALAKEVGRCDYVINYKEHTDFAAEVRKLVPEGVHVVFDGVGQATFDGSLKSLRRRGTLVSFGNASGAVQPVPPLTLTKHGSLFLTRPTLADYVADPEERANRCSDLFRWLADGSLVATIGKEFPLSEARAAHEALEGRSTTGKVVLCI